MTVKSRRVNVKAILADPDLRRKLMVPVVQATQAREGIDTTTEQADRAYHVVTETEKTAFFSLGSFRAARGNPERREEVFVRSLNETTSGVRFDVARRDFGAIEGAPLAFRRVGLVGHIFRECHPLDSFHGRARRGAYTGNDPKYVHCWWEDALNRRSGTGWTWEKFAKGGDFARFYADVDLIVHWDPIRRTFADFHGRKGREIERPESLDDFFRPGLTWPLAASTFNMRLMPSGCVFGHKGPAVFPLDDSLTYYLLGILNSGMAEYLMGGLTSREEMGARWEVGVVKRLPVPLPQPVVKERIGGCAATIHDAKAAWDEGNETSTRFVVPWLLRDQTGALSGQALPSRLGHLASSEASEESRIQLLYSELNDDVYRLYGIPDSTRKIIDETLGERPPELIWPQMGRKTVEQKRMEHVWRLLSYCVKRVVEADDDGIVPFAWSSREPSLIERVRLELHGHFPDQDPNQLEVDIANELKRKVKGYRACSGIEDWLENAFFVYHCDLYKKRPIFWHLASAQGTSPFAFGVLVHYHRFDKNRMAKLRAGYLRDAIEEFRREAGQADKAGRPEDRVEWQARLEETQALDKRLQWVHEGVHEGTEGGARDFRILTPWKESAVRPKGWDPDLDDGVKVNIEPFEKAGVLRKGKVT
jgi:hypothetical protein